MIGDPRNDRTLIISQLHAVFIRWHNLVLAKIAGRDWASSFREARHLLRDRYQWLILNDLLPRLVSAKVVSSFFQKGDRSMEPLRVPAEFTLAAGQLGHAMVQPRYRLNSQVAEVADYPAFHPRIFNQDGDERPLADLRGQRLEESAAIEWDNFFPTGNPVKVQASSKISAKICRPLFRFPLPHARRELDRSIPYRTLVAGQRASLPSGQALANVMGFEPLPNDVIWGGLPYRQAPAPLWFYLLREAAVQQRGERFGELGATIFAAAVIGALDINREPGAQHGVPPDDGTGARETTVGGWIQRTSECNLAASDTPDLG